VWLAGATLVSLPPPPRRTLLPAYLRRYEAVLAAMGCRHLVSDSDDWPPVPGLTVVPLDALAGDDRTATPDLAVPELALVQFTSGSLGAPKGVAISSRALGGHLNMISRCMRHDPDRDVVATWLPMYHDLGLICFLLSGICGRVTQVHSGPRSFALDPSSWLRLLATERATITGAPQFGFTLASRVPYPDDLDLSRVGVVLNGGERLSWEGLEDFHKAASQYGLRWESLLPVYGLAESTVGTTCTLGWATGARRGPGGLVSSGPPLPGARVYCDGTPADPAPIRLGGAWLFDGYFTEHGYEARTGAEFDTGDIGFLDGGHAYVLGRSGDVVSTGGRNLYAEDIESVAVAAGRPWTVSCAAFRLAGSHQRFGLFVEAASRDLADPRGLARTIRAAVSAELGTRVDPVLVVMPGTIPRTTSGKVQRAQCREAYAAGTVARRRILAVLD